MCKKRVNSALSCWHKTDVCNAYKTAPSDTLMTPTRRICAAGAARRNADCSYKECRQADV